MPPVSVIRRPLTAVTPRHALDVPPCPCTGPGEPHRRPHGLQRRLLPPAGDRPGVRGRGEPADDRVVRARRTSSPARSTSPPTGPTTRERSSRRGVRFVAGVVRALAERGARVRGVRPRRPSTVPAGSGLSSSSALSVALTLALADAGGLDVDPTDAARRRCRRDPRHRRPRRAHGPARRAVRRRRPRAAPRLPDPRRHPGPAPPRLAVLVVHSGIPRTLVGSAYAERRAACEAAAARLGFAALRDATLEQVADDPAPATSSPRTTGARPPRRSGPATSTRSARCCSRATRASATTTRSRLPSSTCSSSLVESGAIGARLTGAGFGGCVVALTSGTMPTTCCRGARATAAHRDRAARVRRPRGRRRATSGRAAPPSSPRTRRGDVALVAQPGERLDLLGPTPPAWHRDGHFRGSRPGMSRVSICL